MAIKKRITNQFIYFNYVREDYREFTQFKRELENVLSLEVGNRDVVVDFTGSPGVTSSEIGLLVRLINKFQGTARYLRIVGDVKTIKTLKSTNIQNLENIMVYESQKAFFDEVKKLQNLDTGKEKTD